MRRKRRYATRKPKAAPVVKVHERDVLAAVLSRLAVMPGVKVWRNNVGAMKVDDRFVRFSPVGSSDVFAVIRGRFVSIECKAPGKDATEAQMRWLRECADAGAVSLVVDSIDGLEPLLREAGLIK